MADTLDVKYEFERWMSQQGESAIYIGDGLYSRGAVCDQADAFRAGVEIGRAAALASRPAEVDDEGLHSNSPEIEGIAQSSGISGELPAVLFDGHAVYSEITRKLGKAHCHNHETVSATLDAVVRLMRAAPSHTTNKENVQ